MSGRETPRPLSMLAQRAHRKAVRRRWVRRVILGSGLMLVVLLVGVYVGRGPLTRVVALSRLESALGYEASCSSARILPNGRVSLPELSLRVPGVGGEAGEVVRAGRVELAVDWVRALLSPSSAVVSVRLIDPVVRVSIDVRDGSLNLGSGGGGGAALPESLPPVSVENAVLLFGEHGDGWFAALDAIGLTGRLGPAAGQPGVYEVLLTETSPKGREPAVLEGALDLEAGDGELVLRDVDLSALRVRGDMPAVVTLLRRMRISGTAPVTTLRYSNEGLYGVEVELSSVDVVAPVPLMNPVDEEETEKPLRMSGVTGRLRIDQAGLHGDFFGLFEDVDARVIVETVGYSADADVSAEIVIGDYRIGPSPGLLPFAPEVAGEVLKRYSGPEAIVSGRVRVARVSGEPVVNGLFTWREGTAAFEDFAYPVSDLTGRMTFDGDGIYISELKGVGPTGAVVETTVSVVPPGDDATIVVKVVGTGLPIDEHLFAAIPGEYGETAAMLFSGEVPDGFEVGGEVDVVVDVVSVTGDAGPWVWGVLATSDVVGMSAGVAPYPLVLRGFSVRLDGERVFVESQGVEGPTGLAGSGRVEFPLWDDGAGGLGVEGDFSFEGAPVDEWFLGALRGWVPGVAGLLEKYGATGVVSADGRVVVDDDGASVLVGAVGFEDGALRPGGGGALTGLSGSLQVEPDGVSGRVLGEGPGVALVTGVGVYDFEPEAWDVVAVCTGVELGEETMGLVAGLDETAGRALREVIEEWGLEGVINAGVTGSKRPFEEDVFDIEIDAFEGVGALIGGERGTLGETSGRVVVDAIGGGVRFEDVRAELRGEGGVMGTFALDGVAGGTGDGGRLTVEGTGVRLESVAVRGLIERWGGEGAVAMLAELDPFGAVDLSLVVGRGEDGDLEVSGEIVPGALAVNQDGERVAFDRAEGAVLVGAEGVRFDELRLYADGWGVLLDGVYTEADGYAGAVDVSADRVTPAFLASLPGEVGSVVEAIDFSVGESGELWVTGEVAGGVGETGLVIGFTDASFSIGVRVDRAAGTLRVRDGDEGELLGELVLERFRAATVPMTAGLAELEWEPDSDELDVPMLAADCAGGMIRGQARVAPSASVGGGAEFLVDVRCADVPLAWILERPDEGTGAEDGFRARGVIAGRLTVRGEVGGADEDRVGRGTFTITGGEVVRLPLLTPVFELVNLQPPVGETLDDAAIEFGVAGDRLLFDRLFVRSDSIVVTATGEADLAGGGLDLWVRSSGRKRVPVVSDLMDALRDELVVTRITGSIGSPGYSLVQLPNAGRVLLGALAPGAGGKGERPAPPARPAMVEHVLSTLEPTDE